MFSIEYSNKLAEKYFNDEKEHTMLIKSTRDVSPNKEVKKGWRDISKDDLHTEWAARGTSLVGSIVFAVIAIAGICGLALGQADLRAAIAPGFCLAVLGSVGFGIAALKTRNERSRLKITKGDKEDPVLNALCVDKLANAYGKLILRSFTNLVYEGYLTQDEVNKIHEILDDSTTILKELQKLEKRHLDEMHIKTDRYKEIIGKKKTDAETGKTIPELKQRWRDLQATIANKLVELENSVILEES